MRWMKWWTRSLLLSALAACGDDVREPVDMFTAAPDMQMDVDLGPDGPDASVADLGVTDLGAAADMSAPDLGAAADMSAPEDMFTESDGGPVSTVPVQCRTDADCGGVGSCNLSAPGGICSGCNDTSCPTDTDCSAFGACVRDCSTVADCAPGFRCGSSGCLIDTSCDATVCPAPYVCGSVGCERPPCGTSGDCPSGFSECRGGHCIED